MVGYMYILWIHVVINVTTAHVRSPIPILDTDPGVRYQASSRGAPIRLDVTLDTNCPFSAAAWPELKAAADHYGAGVLDLVVYQFQLPYHRWGHLCSMGFYAIEDQQGPDEAIKYMEYIFKFSVQKSYDSSATEDKSYNEMLDQLAADAHSATGIDLNSFKAVIGDYTIKTVNNWKMNCKRGAAATPSYFLNGVDLAINQVLTSAELRSLIDPLLKHKPQ